MVTDDFAARGHGKTDGVEQRRHQEAKKTVFIRVIRGCHEK
jgi:hypothetical protein